MELKSGNDSGLYTVLHLDNTGYMQQEYLNIVASSKQVKLYFTENHFHIRHLVHRNSSLMSQTSYVW